MSIYQEYKQLNLPHIAAEILKLWHEEAAFEKSIENRNNAKPWVFYEGPPSANGMPGIHHVMARTLKDVFCRYKTMQGYRVERRAGWDTHGLPIELAVEKKLGITKDDIGNTSSKNYIPVEAYNKACRTEVMRFKQQWEDLTQKMGYWVDMTNPYVTYNSKYMESVWWLLAQLYKKNVIYKGYTIQPYSPKAGTGLSSHELNQPGCYKTVKDTSVIAQFKITDASLVHRIFGLTQFLTWDIYALAWTTTPWTLPSNTALTVGADIDYVLVATFNVYTRKPQLVILAESTLFKHFAQGYTPSQALNPDNASQTPIPYHVLGSVKGLALLHLRYEQLIPFVQPAEHPDRAFQIISGDFVTTDDGTGIVHTAPTFGADDARVAAEWNIPGMLVKDENDTLVPLVDLQGKFRPELGEWAGMYVKQEYYEAGQEPEKSADVRISIYLKTQNKAFKVEKYEHSYPHCWRTDTPILYYPLDSWFIKVSDIRDRLVKLNSEIQWKPDSTGSGRFGKWLEHANDWNLSRARFWGIPLPIWTTVDKAEQRCIASVSELKQACAKAVNAGFMQVNPFEHFISGDVSENNYEQIDLHKHIVDTIVLVSDSGKPMYRESDLIDVWFDSGAMPYAQLHYPFENNEAIDQNIQFPADFIAEGVDQTRGWFYTLHVISALLFNRPAFKNVISNGLVLDKQGQKMSKRLGNAVDPFETLNTFGPDATRWYMLANAAPWDNLKFDSIGITEVQRKFFGTVFNTYSFWTLYANVDQIKGSTIKAETCQFSELDLWILSVLNSLVYNVESALNVFEPHRAARFIEDFATEQLSNWYVRLSRRRFWKGEPSEDKNAAYYTLFQCLNVLAKLSAPIAPFFADWLFRNLNPNEGSVHLTSFPKIQLNARNEMLENHMAWVQQVCSLVLSVRKKESIRVRQPLSKIQIPVLKSQDHNALNRMIPYIQAEVNVKRVELINESEAQIIKSLKLNFKTLGKKCGTLMKAVQHYAHENALLIIADIEQKTQHQLPDSLNSILLLPEDVIIVPVDLPGWSVQSQKGITVAVDLSISPELYAEGLSRELVNRIQIMRKDQALELTDRIDIEIKCTESTQALITQNLTYICTETLTNNCRFVSEFSKSNCIRVELDDSHHVELVIIN